MLYRLACFGIDEEGYWQHPPRHLWGDDGPLLLWAAPCSGRPGGLHRPPILYVIEGVQSWREHMDDKAPEGWDFGDLVVEAWYKSCASVVQIGDAAVCWIQW